MAISPDGGLVICGDEGGAIDIRRPDGAPVARTPGQGAQVTALAVSPDGATLASAFSDGAIRLWGLPAGSPAGELRGHAGAARGLAFSPNGARLASAGSDGSLRLWRVPAGAEERAVVVGDMAPALFGVAFSPDGQIIAVAGSEGAVSLWRSSDLTLIERRPIEGGETPDEVAFSPSGGLLARASGGQIYMWGGPGAAAAILSPDVIDLAALPDGDLAALSGGSLRIWRGPLSAPQPYADAAAPGFSSLAAGPGLIALGSRLGAAEVWALR